MTGSPPKRRSLGSRRAAGLAASALLAVPGALPGFAAEPVTKAAAPRGGFEVVVVGAQEGMTPEQFNQAVVDSLPPRLVDPQTNFTRDAAYKADHAYRLIMVFHGDSPVEARSLCARPESGSTGAKAPPPTEMTKATHVTAAFCADDGALSTASGKMLGSVAVGQAGFRFLVADVAKQLFPNGFNTVPGTISSSPPGSAAGSPPPG
jgi:hypothetical protein